MRDLSREFQLLWAAEPSGGAAAETVEREEPVDLDPDLERTYFEHEESEAASEAKAAPKETEAESEETPEPEPVADVQPPSWMEQILNMEPIVEEKQAPGGDIEIPPELADSMLPEAELKALLKIVSDKAGVGTEAAQRASARLQQMEDAHARRSILGSLRAAQHHGYNGIFKNDPVLMGDEKAAAAADKMVKDWMEMASFEALHPSIRDDSKLRQAMDPEFYGAVADLAKRAARIGSGNGTPTPSIPKGAEVASSTAPRPSASKPSPFSKAELAYMKKSGISVADATRAYERKIKGGHGSFDDYDERSEE